MEILHTDSETYIPLIYELLIRPETELTFDDQGLPVTFAEGIPTSIFETRQSVDCLDGLASRWFYAGDPRPNDPRWPSGDTGHGPRRSSAFPEWLRSSERSESGSGRDRYVPKLVEKITDVQQAIDSAALSDERQGSKTAIRTQAHLRLKGLNVLLQLSEKAAGNFRPWDSAPEQLLAAATKFLEELARSDTELDNYALKALLDEINDMAFWTDQDAEPMSLDLWEWLSSLPGTVSVGGSGPRPGRLHVAHALSGGHLGPEATHSLSAWMTADFQAQD